MSRKPCSLKLRAAYSSTFSKVSSGTVIVPGNRMCAVGGDDRPRARRRSTGATSALPSARAIFSDSAFDAHVVLAERHVRPVLLGAADRDDDGRLAGADQVAQLGPREILEQHRRRGLGHARPAARQIPRHSRHARDREMVKRCSEFGNGGARGQGRGSAMERAARPESDRRTASVFVTALTPF